MNRIKGMCGVIAAVTLLWGTGIAVPLEVLQDPNWDTRNNKSAKEQRGGLASSPDDAMVNDYQNGDTANYLCDRGSVRFGTGASTDCWGYRGLNGVEYAIFGIVNGIAVINTQTMTTVGTILGPENGCGSATGGPRWRDMKSYQQYVYATSECSGTNAGLMVIDMSNVPTSVSFVGSFSVNGAGAVTSHNLSIDTVNGYAYVEGNTLVNQSIHIHNLANPASPAFVSSFGIVNGIHDVWAKDDTVLVAEGWNPSVAMYDLSNKFAPVLISRWSIPSPGYVHNVWPSEDLNYCATTEETATKTIKVWDISNPLSATLVGEVLAPSGLAHNAHWKGDKLYISHYESGMVTVDVSNPAAPALGLTYDTWPTETSNFNGCWGAYPFTNNGLVYASNMDGFIYVLEERTDVIADTMWADTTVVAAGDTVEVTIYATNSLPINKFQIPLSWVGPYNMNFVATDRVGTRTDYFQSETYPAFDFGTSRMVITLTASTNGTAPDLAAGSGPILKVRYEVPGAAMGASNPVTFAQYVGVQTYDPSFQTGCINYLPDTTSGLVQLGTCCVDVRGNVNGVGGITVGDLTFLGNYLFGDGAEPACEPEANVNGAGGITVADLTYLVNFLFSAGPTPPTCP